MLLKMLCNQTYKPLAHILLRSHSLGSRRNAMNIVSKALVVCRKEVLDNLLLIGIILLFHNTFHLSITR